MRILYVEDNAVNLSLIARIAQMNKHDLVSHNDAESALAALDAGLTVDLILLDIQLAGEMDGIAFAKTIRAQGRTEPVIAITAYAMTGDKERILEAGCDEYLPKPLPIAEFLALLAKYDPSVSTPAPDTASQGASEAQPAATTSQPTAPTPNTQSEQPAASATNQPTTTTSNATDAPTTPKPPTSIPATTAPPTENKDQNKSAIPAGTASRHDGGNPG